MAGSPNDCQQTDNGDVDYHEHEADEDIGRPVQIVKLSPRRRLQLNESALTDILMRDEIRDKEVVVVSIAGDSRKGKSFLLNFFLRYLQSNGSDNWFDNSERPLNGFSWKGGSERDTTGILMWSEPFILKTADAKEVAVVLINTQGVYDPKSTLPESGAMFALPSMTSSIQGRSRRMVIPKITRLYIVYNLMHNIQEKDLRRLEMFTHYGLLGLKRYNEKPFQKLTFLVRDWKFTGEHPYGLEGGQNLLNKKLKLEEGQDPQLERVRRHIRYCFDSIDCYLMPYPGEGVASGQCQDGKLPHMDTQFAVHLKAFVENVLHPNNIVVKHIDGRPLTACDLLYKFQVYTKRFAGIGHHINYHITMLIHQDGRLPTPKTLLEANGEADHRSALRCAFFLYLEGMDEVCSRDMPYIKPEALAKVDKRFRIQAANYFDNKDKRGGQDMTDDYRKRLLEIMEREYKIFENFNHQKRPIATIIRDTVRWGFSGIRQMFTGQPASISSQVTGHADQATN